MNQRNKLILAGHCGKRNGLYKIDILLTQSNHATKIVRSNTTLGSDSKLIELWHQRFGHLNYNNLSYLSRHNKVTGMPSLNPIKTVCAQCLAERQHCERFPKKSFTRTKDSITSTCRPCRYNADAFPTWIQILHVGYR